jgi:broad specificity phosphatase PhoE
MATESLCGDVSSTAQAMSHIRAQSAITADPELTELGVEQAKHAYRAWKAELEYNIPLPEKLYSSPMRRAIKTNQVTFEGLLRPGLKTTIVEAGRSLRSD